jgi:hypothetical protein
MKNFFSSIRGSFGRHGVFLLSCAVVFAILAAVMPSYFPLMQPDSDGYINFSPTRTSLYPLFLKIFMSLGLDFVQITYVQNVLFSLALIVLLAALLRAGVPRIFVAAFSISLGASSYFSTFHRTIMTESLFCTFVVLGLAFLIDYFRTGKVTALAWTGLFMGIAIGIRPAGVTLAPMLLLAAWLKWRDCDVSRPLFALGLILPLVIGPLAERIVYHAKHGAVSASLSSFLLIGKGAMLIRKDTAFAGRYAAVLEPLGQQLYESYVPVHQFLAGVPIGAIPVFTATYESIAQFQMLRKEIGEASVRLSVPGELLFSELGLQSIESNISGYLGLSLIHYVGQWSVASLTFPPTARAVNDYVGHQQVPFEGLWSDITLHPPAKLSSYVVYPAFLAAGFVTFILSIALIPFLIWPSLAQGEGRQYFLIAAFLGASCQAYTIFLCFVNVSTPRFILSYYPQLLLIGIFMALAIWPRLASKTDCVDPSLSR